MFSSTVIVSSFIECTGTMVRMLSVTAECSRRLRSGFYLQNPRRKEEELQCNAAIMCSAHMLGLCAYNVHNHNH